MARKKCVTPKQVAPEQVAPEQVAPQPKYREVCRPLPANNFVNHYDWELVVYQSQSTWPEYVNEVYFYQSYLHILDDGDYCDDEAEFSRISEFLEKGAKRSVLVYRRHTDGFSWVVLDEIAYSELCEYLGIAKDFVVREQNPGKLELLSPKTVAEIESQPPRILF